VPYWTVAQKLLGRVVVVYMPDRAYDQHPWKGGYLYGLIPGDDLFQIKWTKKGFGRTLPGIWRVHPSSLFRGTKMLPVPKYPARLPQSTNTSPKEDEVATRKPAAKTKATTKKAPAKKTADNGAKKSTGRTRGPDKLEGLTEAKKRNIAKLIFRERSKSPATSWPDIIEMVQDKYDWTLPGSMTGRRLLREYGPDDAEAAIIKQDRTAAKKKVAAKAKTKTKKKVVEDEDEEDIEDDEDLDDDEEMEEDLEDEDEDEDDEDDEDEDDEDEEPEPPKAKKVRVTRGRGKKSNPS
jgi:hypothetical protein